MRGLNCIQCYAESSSDEDPEDKDVASIEMVVISLRQIVTCWQGRGRVRVLLCVSHYFNVRRDRVAWPSEGKWANWMDILIGKWMPHPCRNFDSSNLKFFATVEFLLWISEESASRLMEMILVSEIFQREETISELCLIAALHCTSVNSVEIIIQVGVAQ